MPPLRIPPHYREGIRAIANLDDGEVAQLAQSLRETPERLAPERLARDVQEAVPSLREDAHEAVEALVSLIALLEEDEAAVEELAHDVARSEDLEIGDTEREELAQRMSVLLRLPPLVLAARAYDIASEHERVFHDARIITDIRPVFGASVSEGPRAALISAMLKVEWHPYSRGGSLDSEFFALDSADLIRLREVVDRALDKIASLEQFIGRTSLPYWEYRGVEEPSDATDS